MASPGQTTDVKQAFATVVDRASIRERWRHANATEVLRDGGAARRIPGSEWSGAAACTGRCVLTAAKDPRGVFCASPATLRLPQEPMNGAACFLSPRSVCWRLH